MEAQGQLLPDLTTRIAVSAHWVPGEGWDLLVCSRTEPQSWWEGTREDYDELTAAELCDALDASLRHRLGI